jgi:hypothetical protein
MRTAATFILLCLCMVSSIASGQTYDTPQHYTTREGISFPHTLNVSDQNLLYLNGVGYRKATIFSIKVYVAALYVPRQTHEPETILAMEEERRLRLFFLRTVSEDDVQEAFTYNFEDNNEASPFLEKIKTLATHLPRIEKNDILEIIFNKAGVAVMLNNQQLAADSNPAFGMQVLRIWLGPKPPNSSLKRDILSYESLTTDD